LSEREREREIRKKEKLREWAKKEKGEKRKKI